MNAPHSRLTCALLYGLTKVRVTAITAWVVVVVMLWLSASIKFYWVGIGGFVVPRQDRFLLALVSAIALAVFFTLRWLLKEFDRWARRRYENDC